jgi:hypothetical protein
MFTAPDPDMLLEGLIFALQDEILPALGSPKAMTTAVMMQNVLQQIRQTLPVYLGYLVEEHNAMIGVLRDTAAALGDASGPAADRIRDRASALGATAALPVPPAVDATMDGHRRLGVALTETYRDLDELQRAGVASADAALQVVRGHFGPRYVRDVMTTSVGDGFVGRG